MDFFGIEDDVEKTIQDRKEKCRIERLAYEKSLVKPDGRNYSSSVGQQSIGNSATACDPPPIIAASASSTNGDQSDLNFIDQNYFGQAAETGSKKNSPARPQIGSDRKDRGPMFARQKGSYTEEMRDSSATTDPVVPRSRPQTDLGYIDEEYFGDRVQTDFKSRSVVHRPLERGGKSEVQRVGNQRRYADPAQATVTRDGQPLGTASSAPSPQSKASDEKRTTEEGDVDESTPAADVVREMRKKAHANQHLDTVWDWKSVGTQKRKNAATKVDSQGYRIPNEQKYKFEYLTQEEVTDVLLKCVLNQMDGLIAINKPYGLPSHDGPGHHHSVSQLLPRLAERLKLGQPLHLVHRLDKETTGVMLLAKTPEMANLLKEAFRNRLVTKSYLCITCNVPENLEGIIDMPIKEALVKGGFHKMMVRPRYDTHYPEHAGTMRHYGTSGAVDAVTKYTVLDRRSGCALVDCVALTGVKHQIRVHLSMGTNTPILGDHKYSHVSRVIPQRLDRTILQALGIRQSKTRYIALHLHAHRLLIGGKDSQSESEAENLSVLNSNWYKGDQVSTPPLNFPRLHFRAPLPGFFADNLRRLKLQLPKMINLARSRFI